MRMWLTACCMANPADSSAPLLHKHPWVSTGVCSLAGLPDMQLAAMLLPQYVKKQPAAPNANHNWANEH